MNVTEIIETMQDLAFSRTFLLDEERKNYLRFLNLANAELWQVMTNAKQFYENKQIFIDNDKSIIDIPNNIFQIKDIFTDKLKLQQCKFDEIFNMPVGTYYLLNKQILLNKTNLPSAVDEEDGETKQYVNVIVVPNLKELVEDVDNPEFETDIPEYPINFHYGLIQGAMLYIYMSNKGFSEKIALQNSLWINVKKDIANYYS